MQNQLSTSQNIQTPLVTFIITIYNLPTELVRECIDSILALSLAPADREIIVIDDGSDTPIIECLHDIENDFLYVRQPNQGLSIARNTGIQIASGKYIQFVDGDDYLIQAPYEHCLDIARYHNPDMVCFEFTHSKKQETSLTLNKAISGIAYLHNYNLHAAACGYLFKKEKLGKLRFTPKIFHEDEEFTPLLLLRAETVIRTDTKAYFYRMRKQSIINDSNKKHILQRLEDTQKVIFRLKEVSESIPETARIALERRIAQLTMDYLYNIIKLTKNHRYLEKAISQLQEKKLYPLPDKKYTKKYSAFRRIINSNLGKKIMIATLPRL